MGGRSSQELTCQEIMGVANQEPTTVMYTTSSNTVMSKGKHPAILIEAYYQTLSTYKLQKYR